MESSHLHEQQSVPNPSASYQSLSIGVKNYLSSSLDLEKLVSRGSPALTHLPLVLHICVSELAERWFR